MKTTDKKLNMTIAVDSQELARRTLELFISDVRKAIEARGRFCSAISRQTPGSFFELLGSDYRSKSLPWNKIHLFSVDKCCGSNDFHNDGYNLATRTLLSRVTMPPENVHRICSNCRHCEYSASIYEQAIYDVLGNNNNEVPHFDLIMLQMEADGHVASLFPDTYAFFEPKKLVWVTHFMDKRRTRITMTHPLLCAASHIAVLVSGREKAVLLRELFASELNIVRYPIHALWPILDRVTWLVDRDAARFLSEPTCRNGIS
jgi:6-phosphogluconolactonase